ncbi:hypothetical protein I4U23_027356 [Adineta vaga]|nr:hypothetical protein I4U23_027356 [Adineta vaga]
MLSRLQKPSLRDFMMMQGQTRTRLCVNSAIFDPCEKLTELTPFEKASLMSWYSDTTVDKGLNLYILLHYLSAVNNNSYYYHYVNNGNPDGTNMFGHVIGTSGSGKSSALTPHMDALNRTLSQMDIKQEYIQKPNKNIELLFEQPFIVSNSTTLQVFRSLIYGNRILCSTECDTLLSNLGVYGNQYNDPRFAENVNMLIQMFDGTKHQNRATLSTSYNIPEGRRASIIGASVGDPYARVSQQHYEGNGVSGAHNRFTHYPCPVMKAIKTNSGTSGVVSNMVPSLQHVYTVSFLLDKVEYIPRQNVYDKSEKKQSNVFHSDVEEKWNRLRPTSDREYCHSPSKIKIDLEAAENDASYEHSKSAHYYMFNRVYQQWQEATETEKQEHEAIISFKNSTKIPRFICNFARFRTIMDILWDDDVYPLIEISEIVKSPYRVSDDFIDAVKKVIEKRFPVNLRTDDGTKIVVIEKSTAIMGDLFFGHVDYVSRQLFDLSSIQEKFSASPIVSRLQNSSGGAQEKNSSGVTVYADALVIILSKFIFFSTATFTSYREFHNNKERLSAAIKYLIDNGLVFQPLNKSRFIKGTRSSYAMATPKQIKQNNLAIEALINLNLTTIDYEQLWQDCLLFSPDVASKIDKTAIDHINSNLIDYISIIHRLGDANDPVAQEILKPGLFNGQIGINPLANTFSLSPEHTLQSKDDDYITNLMHKLCISAVAQTQNNDSSKKERTSLTVHNHPINNTETTMIDLSENVQRLQTQFQSSSISIDVLSSKNDRIENSRDQVLLKEKGNETFSMSHMDSIIMNEYVNVSEALDTELENNHAKTKIIHNDVEIIYNMDYTNNSTSDINKSLPTAFKSIVVENMSAIDIMNIDTATDLSTSVEYDYVLDVSMNIHTADSSLQQQQQQQRRNQESFSELSSFVSTEKNNDEHHDYFESNSMETDFQSDFKTTSFSHTTSTEYINVSKDMNENSTESNTESNTEPNTTPELVALSKRLMLKSFIAFTKTDVTRLFNSAETKNSVIGYLKHHKLIKEIADLFVSSIPTKKTIKYETGYVKIFPASKSASDTSSFESKLRVTVGIGLDEYIDNVLIDENLPTESPIVNNIFNTTYHKWLLNRHWYDKIKAGEVNPITTISKDNVIDLFDQPRSSMTSTQRTDKELRRLGVKRQKKSNNEPLPKRQRKPKRFPDDDQ